MTLEEKKQFLELHDTFLTELILLPKQIQDLKLNMLPSGIRYSDMPKSHSQRDLMADFAARLEDMENRLADAIQGLYILKGGINNIKKPLERRVVYSRFIDHETWYGIAYFEQRSVRGVQYACQRGTENLCFENVELVKKLIRRYY